MRFSVSIYVRTYVYQKIKSHFVQARISLRDGRWRAVLKYIEIDESSYPFIWFDRTIRVVVVDSIFSVLSCTTTKTTLTENQCLVNKYDLHVCIFGVCACACVYLNGMTVRLHIKSTMHDETLWSGIACISSANTFWDWIYILNMWFFNIVGHFWSDNISTVRMWTCL